MLPKGYMRNFNTSNDAELEKTVTQLKTATCPLDSIRTAFFKGVIDCLSTSMLETLNLSL